MLLCTRYWSFIGLGPHGSILFTSSATCEVGSIGHMAPGFQVLPSVLLALHHRGHSVWRGLVGRSDMALSSALPLCEGALDPWYEALPGAGSLPPLMAVCSPHIPSCLICSTSQSICFFCSPVPGPSPPLLFLSLSFFLPPAVPFLIATQPVSLGMV